MIRRINHEVVQTRSPFEVRYSRSGGSDVAHVRFGEGGSDYFLKVKRPRYFRMRDKEEAARIIREALRREVCVLQQLAALLPFQHLDVPRLLYFDEERMALATVQVPGVGFLRAYRFRHRMLPLKDGRLRRDLRHAGAALGELHGLDVRCPDHGDGVSMEGFRSSVRAGRDLYPESLLDAVGAWDQEIETLLEDPAEPILSHNDFATHNLLVREDHRIGVLDFEGVARDRPERDLATFRISLSHLAACLPSSDLRRLRSRRLWNWFLEGYDRTYSADRLRARLVRQLVVRIENHRWSLDGASGFADRLYRSRILASDLEFLTRLVEAPEAEWWA